MVELKKSFDISKIEIQRAELNDSDDVFKLVSDAYIIEVGNTGI